MPRFAGTEFARFIVNGLVATVVHFAVLTALLEIAQVPLAAIANFIAASFGITVSFLGNRYFVFKGQRGPLMRQFLRFAGIYLVILVLHTGLMFAWTDVLSFDYRMGFLIATGLQVTLSYLGNKLLVFA